MKKIFAIILAAVMALAALGCGGGSDKKSSSAPAPQTKTSSGTTAKASAAPQSLAGKKVLVAYFSWSGNTRAVAERIASETNGEIFEIVPATPYPSDYSETADQAKQEQSENARPAIAGDVADFASYDVVMLGFPIWWYREPMIIDTFLETHDFAGKTIVPFSTSGGSDIADAVSYIRSMAGGATVLDGINFTDRNNLDGLEDWLSASGVR